MASTEAAAIVVKEKKPRASKGSKPPPSHPTYLQKQLLALKERTGSSHYAIAHYIDGKYQSLLPANYKKLLTVQLRNLAKSGKLSKVKGSFKLAAPAAQLKKPAKTVKPKPKPKPAKAATAPIAQLKKPVSAKPKPKAAKKVGVVKPKAASTKVTKATKPSAKKVVAAPKKAAATPAPKKAVKPAAKKAVAAPVKRTPKRAKK